MKVEQRPSVLSHHENKALEAEEQKLQDIKDGVELQQGVKYEAEDLAALETKLAQVKKIREERGNHGLSENEKIFYEKKAKMIQDYMLEHNPSFKEYSDLRPSDGPRYNRLVQRISKDMSDPEHQNMVREWQDCKRRLDPEDPFAADTRLLYKGAT